MLNSERPYVVVVGVDYSPVSDLALERAFELAAARSIAEVHVVHVVGLSGVEALVDGLPEASSLVSLPEATAQLGRYAEQRWAAFARERREPPAGVGRVVSHLRLNAPAEEIAQVAVDLEADLLVVGTHGRRGVARLLLGSVAESVVRLAPCPVFVVRPKDIAEEAPGSETPNVASPAPSGWRLH